MLFICMPNYKYPYRWMIVHNTMSYLVESWKLKKMLSHSVLTTCFSCPREAKHPAILALITMYLIPFLSVAHKTTGPIICLQSTVLEHNQKLVYLHVFPTCITLISVSVCFLFAYIILHLGEFILPQRIRSFVFLCHFAFSWTVTISFSCVTLCSKCALFAFHSKW